MPGLKITVIDEHIRGTGDADIDVFEETDVEQAQSDQAEQIEAETEASENPAKIGLERAKAEDAQEQAQDPQEAVAAIPVVQSPDSGASVPGHRRVEEFCHTGGVVDFVDFLSHGEAVSTVWRISGQGTYHEETQAVDANGDLHAQKIVRTCDVDIAMRWTNGYDTVLKSFVNVVATPGGGMHVTASCRASPSRFARRWKTTRASSRSTSKTRR